MLSNAYFIAKCRFDRAENKPAKKLQKFANNLQIFINLIILPILLILLGDIGAGPVAGEALLGPGHRRGGPLRRRACGARAGLS